MKNFFRDVTVRTITGALAQILVLILFTAAGLVGLFAARTRPSLQILVISLGIVVAVAIIIHVIAVRWGNIRALRHAGAIAEELDDLARRLSHNSGSGHLRERTHRFEAIKASYQISGNDAVYTVQYHARNQSKRPADCLVRGFTGDSAADDHLLDLKAVDLTTDEFLRVEIQTRDSSPFQKIFRVRYPSPLPRGKLASVQVQCNWRGTFARQDDYVFFPASQFRYGIDKLDISVSLPTRPTHFVGYDIRHGRLQIARVQPEWRKQTNGGQVIVGLTKPKHDYVIKFRRTDCS